VSIVLLAIAFLVIAGVMVEGLQYTAAHPGQPPCGARPVPAPRGTNDQLLVVGICVLTFVLGHLTARWQAGPPQPGRKPELDVDRMRTRGRQGMFVQLAVTIFLAEMATLLAIEIITLSTNHWPITWYVRCAYDAAGWQTSLGGAAITFLSGRWFWLRGPGRVS